MESSKKDAEKDGVKVPMTLEEYCVKTVVKNPAEETDTFDMYDDDYYEMSDDEDNLEDAEGSCAAGCSTAPVRPNDSGLFDNDSEGDSGQGEN